MLRKTITYGLYPFLLAVVLAVIGFFGDVTLSAVKLCERISEPEPVA